MPPRRDDAAGALQGARILVVEDDFMLRLEMETVLRDAGATHVHTCSTVDEALRTTQAESFGAAVLDMRLGRETVAPVAHRLTELGTPFCFYTGQVANDAAIAQWPQVRVVSKPASPATLISAVAALLISSATPQARDR